MDFTFVPVSAFVQADSQQPNPQANGVFIANSGAGLLAWGVPIGPVTSGNITANINTPQAITLTAVSGTTFGVNWQLAPGQTIVLDPNTTNQEAVVLASVLPASNQVTGVIRKNHSYNANVGGVAVTAFFLDQARSAMDPDLAAPQGVTQVQLAAIDAVTGLLSGARSATTDNLRAANSPVSTPGLINKFTGLVDRAGTDGSGRALTADRDWLELILTELRTITAILVTGLNVSDEPDAYRTDSAINDITQIPQ